MGELTKIKGVGRGEGDRAEGGVCAGGAAGAERGGSRAPIETAEDVARLLGEEMRLLDYESVRVICLNTKHKVLAVEEVTRGTLNESLFHPREAFRPALARQAHAVILVHNHPSGNPQPSDADLHVTRRMKQAGELLQIELLDHVILGAPRSGRWARIFSVSRTRDCYEHDDSSHGDGRSVGASWARRCRWGRTRSSRRVA